MRLIAKVDDSEAYIDYADILITTEMARKIRECSLALKNMVKFGMHFTNISKLVFSVQDLSTARFFDMSRLGDDDYHEADMKCGDPEMTEDLLTTEERKELDGYSFVIVRDDLKLYPNTFDKEQRIYCEVDDLELVIAEHGFWFTSQSRGDSFFSTVTLPYSLLNRII